MTEEWSSYPTDVISNCFTHRYNQSPCAVDSTGDKDAETVNSMTSHSTEHGVSFTKDGLQNLVAPGYEDGVTEELLM